MLALDGAKATFTRPKAGAAAPFALSSGLGAAVQTVVLGARVHRPRRTPTPATPARRIDRPGVVGSTAIARSLTEFAAASSWVATISSKRHSPRSEATQHRLGFCGSTRMRR